MVVLGSAAHSYFVQRAWSRAAGHAYGTAPPAIPFADRITWAAHDLFGMFLLYSAVTSIALVCRIRDCRSDWLRFTGFRAIVFGLAGAVSPLHAIYGPEGI
jgi:uncharacterized membrane protein HdeD (DUF308 family)